MGKIHVALVGPIRPNMDYILYLIKKLKNDIPQIITHISYWKTNVNDKNILLNNFDFVYENDEPLLEDCVKKINRVPSQVMHEPFPFSSLINVYKTFVNMHYFFDKSIHNIADQDILFRFRTDIEYQIININEFNNFINNIGRFPQTYYMVMRSDRWKGSCDWHGISTYINIKKVWDFPEIMNSAKDYNTIIGSVYNPESIITKKLINNNIQVITLNSMLRLTLCREYDLINGFQYCYGNMIDNTK
jgi:hypothetical protein